MGFYIRKSKKVGPFRLNLSKSGLGVSAGVKGFRVSTGPRGTYLNAGRNGLYYRQKIGSSSIAANNPKNQHSTRTTNRTSSGWIKYVALLLVIFYGVYYLEKTGKLMLT